MCKINVLRLSITLFLKPVHKKIILYVRIRTYIDYEFNTVHTYVRRKFSKRNLSLKVDICTYADKFENVL